ncbi:response regulator (plasmid) [Polaromonas sp. P1-6]|nr:response regulator [Polaromonas sp. P1-6]
MQFPIYCRPGGIVFLDDDLDFLQMVAEVMPNSWHVRLFHRPVKCAEVLDQEQTVWEADTRSQQEIINRWRNGAPLIPQILKYWREDGTTRFSLTQVCVVDYSMPAKTGLQFLDDIQSWKGSRILLTGRADEQIAVGAFNRGLIDKYIPKQIPELRLRLVEAIHGMLQKSAERHQQTWLSTLSQSQQSLISDPLISKRLGDLAQMQGWVEHVVIGAPFGVLSLDFEGTIRWLQLETSENLHELVEIAESQGWDDETVQEIKVGEKLIDLELQQALGDGRQPQPRDAFTIEGENTALHAAQFGVYEDLSVGFMNSHGRFLASQAERALQD